MKKRVAVIGAGIAGVVTAHELQKKGFEVRVFEKNQRLGGRMATHVKGGLEFNSGATLMSQNYTTLRAYSEEFGVEWSPMLPGSTHRVIKNGTAYKFDLKGPMGVFKLNVLSWPARLRFLWWLISLSFKKSTSDFFNLSTLTDAENSESAGKLLRNKVDAEVEEYIADPFTGALHFHPAYEASAGVLISLISSMIGNAEFSARYPVGGVQKIPEAIAQGLDVVYGADISNIENLPGGPYDAVVLACPAPVAEKMIQKKTPAQGKLFSVVRYASTIVISYKVPEDLFPDTTHCIYVPYRENDLVSSLIFEGRKGDGLVVKGETLMNVSLWDASAKELLQKSDEEILARVTSEIPKLCPEMQERASEISFHAIERWEHAMPKFSCELISAVKEFQEDKNGQGANSIFLVGDYMNAPWTEGSARAGQRLASHISSLF